LFVEFNEIRIFDLDDSIDVDGVDEEKGMTVGLVLFFSFSIDSNS
jgi:hypothetical protein